VPRIVPRDELLRKTAALQSADALGRVIARDQANEELAKLAGLIMSGAITPEEWEMLKEAGIFSALGSRIAKSGWGSAIGRAATTATKPIAAAGKAMGGAGQRVYSWGKAAVKPVGQAASAIGKTGPVKQVTGIARSLGTAAKVAPWLAMGGLAYGAIKGVPWAARQLEHSSSQTMAPSMGWSATPYGYGSSPWGQGMPTMGPGA
jgi:hypothetical protein